MTELSPQAQAVWHAYETVDCNPYEIDPRQAGVAAAIRAAVAHTQQRQYGDCWICDAAELLAIAAELDGAALAQPEPQGATESDLSELFYRHVGEGSEVGFENAIAEALARWGRPAIEPIPVSERLPGPEDCDEEGRCWWFCPASLLPNGMCAYWCLAPADPPKSWHTHWRPYRALTLPPVT